MQDNNNTSTVNQIHPALVSSSLLRGLAEGQAQALAAELTMAEFLPGMRIFGEGALGDHLYVICTGKIKISQSVGTDAQRLKHLLGPGELFGAAFELESGLHTTTATAATGITAARIRYSRLNEWIAVEPNIQREILIELSGRAIEFHARRDEQLVLSVRSRLVKLFLLLGQRFGREVGGAISLKHHLDHSELGDLIGADRQAVHGAMTELIRLGVISRKRRGVNLLDPQVLAHLAE
ncbi:MULTISPECIES: Crp/Fnr family transcriptional regulator [unclassified Crossiella]|uniref:Crp/Fnr family transcriptional regulator n=1 Tax=unclassified Crossiella TaxID=2620835 RepID=UPI001FFEFCD0|nr:MULTISPECIES: Crp/Fnr family transcriptional regulator [unclassified Crossiella]MCK2240683.1 Crp/Fnr family transcriptional regulator [Crossiella sp. S99.2]MCK2252866.1 Crp/Fnr family transcriptional regulator [Crossiella sp. S99.1]